MIYLNNNTLLQDVYIPRQDMLPYTTGSSGTYAEGYSDGYEDGTQDQKDKLASTAFTENGLYTREDGWNEVEVSVEAPLPVLEDKTVVISADTTTVTPSSGYDGMSQVIVDASGYAQENYDGGFEDGFEDGYSSGSTDEKAKLSGVTFTANTAVTVSDGGYSAVTVNVPQTGHTDQELEDAYESGYTSGQTDQKNLLTTTAFTENGSYQRENGWSGVTVNIDTASTWTDGYSSGETHQKSLLTTTAITVNGNYTRENGWSGITVNVPTGSSYNVEQNKPFTATSNGNYTITPSSGQTNKIIGYEDGVDFYFTASTYPSVGYFDIGAIDFENSQGSIIGSVYIYYENGHIDYDDSDWAGRIYTRTTGNTMLYVGFDEDDYSDYVWIEGEDFSFNYDVMSAVSLNVNIDTASTYQSGYTDGQDSIIGTFSSMTATTNGVYGSSAHPLSSITVNVPQSGGSGTTKIFFADYIHTDTLQADSRDRINTGIYPTTATTFRVKGLGKGLSAGYELVGFDLNDAGEESDYRLFCYSTSGEILGFDWYSERITNENWGGLTDGKGIDFTCSNYQVYDNINETVLLSGSPQSNMQQGIPIYVNVASWWLKGLEIWEGNTKVFDGVAAYDENGNVGLYDSVSNALVTNENLTLVYENVDEYQYGFNDGQNSIINTFSSMTVTTNGVYGTSAHPLSSITVNVPQSGSNNIFFADYIHTETIPTNDAEINTGIYASTDISIRIKCLGKGYQLGERGDNIFGFGPNEGASDGDDFRLMCYDNNTVLAYDWRSDRIYTPYSGLYDGREIDYTCGNYYVYDNIEQEYLITGNTQSYVNESVPIYVNVGKIWLKSFEIWKGQTKVFDGKAAYDSAGNIGLYDSVSNELLYNSNLSMVYEIISPSNYLIPYIERTLTKIDVPSGCTKVGSYAFDRCYSATSITIPDSVTNLDTHAFAVCDAVTSITFGNGLVTIGDNAFYKVGYMSEVVNNNNLVLPDSVSTIGDNAFLDMPITAITFGSGTTYLGDEILAHTPVVVMYSYATSAPQLKPSITSEGTFYRTFRYMDVNNGTVHYPSGSDYSRWQNNQYLSGWTFIADL